MSERMQCLHLSTLETSEIDLKVQLPLQHDLHVHRAMGAPYWPILAYFENFKINISTRHIQAKHST